MAFSRMSSSVEPGLNFGGKRVDLAFVIDCTGSMGDYIDHARENITRIAEAVGEQRQVDMRFALIQYQDHPQENDPQSEYVTKVYNFTEHLKEIKAYLEQCEADGGGDPPEAVTDAMQDLLKLSWRPNAVKICVWIADAPPHGLGCSGDSFDSGCPCGLDPMEIAHQLAEKEVQIYVMGCEPSISPYKEWFMAISLITSGQYLPMASANPLSRAIIASLMEELSLSDLKPLVASAVLTSGRLNNKEALIEVVLNNLKGSKTKVLESESLLKPTEQARQLAELKTMEQVRQVFKPFNQHDSSADDPPTSAEYKAMDSDITREQATRMVTKMLASSKSLITNPKASFVKL